MDGIEACRIIKRSNPGIQVIACSLFNEDNLIIDMPEAGAKGYLLKNTNNHGLPAAVKAFLAANRYNDTLTDTKPPELVALKIRNDMFKV